MDLEVSSLHELSFLRNSFQSELNFQHIYLFSVLVTESFWYMQFRSSVRLILAPHSKSVLSLSLSAVFSKIKNVERI
jgi:hypothetical protein